jgi:pilus assembly protein FimV
MFSHFQLGQTNMGLAGQQAAAYVVCDQTSSAPTTMRWMRVGLRASVLAIGLIFGDAASAVGLGALHIKSALSHPLRAQIDLISPNETDLERRCYQVTVNALDGSQLSKVSVEVKTDGPLPALLLSSADSIDEPAVALSVTANCGAATHREYQVLLDLMPTPAVVDTPRPAAVAPTPALPAKQQADTDRTSQFSVGPSVASNDAPTKKSRRHHNGSEVVPNSAYSPAPPLASSTSIEPRRKTHGAKKYRNVLKLSDDDNVDTSLDDTVGMHLRVSHGLFGSSAAEPDAQAGAPASTPAATQAANQAVTSPVATPPAQTPQAGNGNDNAAAPGSPTATDLTLQVLQAKIRLLETQTEELRKLNAIQQGKLDAAQKAKSDRSQLLSLYFLLFLSFIAIVWLVWRMRQIEADITDSHWHHIVPDEPQPDESTTQSPPPASVSADDDDSFLDEPRKFDKPDARNVTPIKPLPKLVAVERAEAPVRSDTEPALSAPSEQPRQKSDTNELEYKANAPARAALPDAEEILDEIQQAEFWMEMHQPERAIEILESNWGSDRPNSPLPWLYLLDLYKQVGDREQYEELTERFEHIFNGKVERWDDDKATLTVQRSLEDFPAVLKKIVQLWPTPDIVPYMENLLIDDRDGRRQGFELSAYRDILFLTNIAYAMQDEGESKAAHTAPEWSLLN